MRDDPTRFIGSIPYYYDKRMGPVIFAEPADVAARRVGTTVAASPCKGA